MGQLKEVGWLSAINRITVTGCDLVWIARDFHRVNFSGRRRRDGGVPWKNRVEDKKFGQSEEREWEG